MRFLPGTTQTPAKQIFSRPRKTPRKSSKKTANCDIKTPQANHHKNHNNGKMEEIERLKNQKEFREILAKYGITQAQAAELITRETSRTIKLRTLRTWLASPEAVSAKPCPIWAIVALKKALDNPPSTTQKQIELK